MQRHLTIHGVSVTLQSQEKAFLNFCDRYFKGFAAESAPDAMRISVSFLSGYSFRMPQAPYTPHTLGSGIGWDAPNNTLYLTQREISARITLTTPWYAEVSFQKNLFRHLANKFFFSRAKTQENYYRAIVRLIAQQLVFMQLMQRWNVTALSAAAVKIRGRAHIFAGLPGSGKSTLIHDLKKNLGAEILAENYVLTDGERLFPFPEGNTADVAPCAIGSLSVISHGDAFLSYALPREQAYHTLLAINALTAELPEQSPYGALTLVDPTRWQFLLDRDHETLKKLCERHICNRLVCEKELAATRAHIEKNS